jgi:hypothetical protein
VGEIVDPVGADGKLGSGVAFDGKFEGVRIHAFAVVFDQDERSPAARDGHRDAVGAGIERVLDELLDRGGGTLDHLARGDAVDRALIEAANGGSCSCL